VLLVGVAKAAHLTNKYGQGTQGELQELALSCFALWWNHTNEAVLHVSSSILSVLRSDYITWALRHSDQPWLQTSTALLSAQP
jgi:hypothetical protein